MPNLQATEKAKELFNILLPIYRNLDDLVVGTMGHCKTDSQRQKLIDAIKNGLTDWTDIMFFCWNVIDAENHKKIISEW